MDRSVARHRRGKRLALSALALATVASTALVASSTASAADGDVTSGSLSWAVSTTGGSFGGWNGYITAPAWGDGSINPVAPSTTSFAFPGATGSITATAVDVQTTGGVQWLLPAHGIDVRFEDLRVVVAGTALSVYGDIAGNYVTGAFGQPAGAFANSDVLIATGTATVQIVGGNATVTSTSLAFTEESGDAGFPGFSQTYVPDQLVLTAAIEQSGGSTFVPQVSASKNWVATSGDTITVNITGFDPTLLGNGAPAASQPAGYYVVIGSFADAWKITEGVPSTVGGVATRPNIAQLWASPIFTGAAYVTLDANGNATAPFTVPSFDPASLVNGVENFGIYTYPAATRTGAGTSWTLTPEDWAARAPYETFTPLNIFTSSAQSQSIVAEIEHEASGEFGWTIEQNDPVLLGNLTTVGETLVATGEINAVTITDTRIHQDNSWSITGIVSPFSSGTDGFGADALGWEPKVITPGAGAVAAGPASGLGSGSTLASAPTDHAPGAGVLGADLTLTVPWDTPEGTYTATLTLTALS